MTSDSILYRPTESLILPGKRRFFPLKIPNFHPQLRHYISTVDPDRIYVIAERTVYAIHISLQKKESIAIIPFEPRCLAAGFGWIAVGGPDNGECAYLRINDRDLEVRDHSTLRNPADVDAALPIDLDLPSRLSSPSTENDDPTSSRYSPRRRLAEFAVHKFGGSIVNSVTIHQFPAKGENGLSEDVMILSNNDKSVTVFSLTRTKVLNVIQHPTCMNYATISPDQTLLTAVGDENRAYFYSISRDWESPVVTDTGGKFPEWEWQLIRCVEMEIGQRIDDACCFTIAFSPSGHLCAIGSQSGVVTVLDVEAIQNTTDHADLGEPVVCQFPATRSCAEGGAVRCLTFSPEPWDLLVWLEGHGRAGVADVRQEFLRRQVLQLDLDDPILQETHLDTLPESSELSFLDDLHTSEDSARRHPIGTANDFLAERGADEPRHSSLRDHMIQDLTERERLIMEFLNTARWTTRLEDGLIERPERPARAPLHPQLPPRARHHDSNDGTPTSPPLTFDPAEVTRDEQSGRSGAPVRQWHARRQSSVVLSQGSRSSETGASSNDHQPNVTLSWTTSPSELQSTGSDNSRGPDPDLVNDETGSRPRSPETVGLSSPPLPPPIPPVLDLAISSDPLARLRSQRSSSTPRRTERPAVGERRYDAPRLTGHEIRASLAAERYRRQRQYPSEVFTRSSEQENRQRQQNLGFEQTHSPRWIRNIINDLPDRSLIHGSGAEEPDATAGVGWGADGRTLYIATLEGIFEFQLNIHDRKTFPVISYR